MQRDHYIFDETQMTLTGRRTGESFRLGDRVEVRLEEAVPLAGALRFELLSEGRYVEPASGFGKRRGSATGGACPSSPLRPETRKTSQMTAMTPESRIERDWRQAMGRGFMGRCPACGEGKLFDRFLKPVEACASCGEAMHHQRADDLPPYIIITIVGHIVVGGMVMAEQMDLDWSYLTHALVWGTMIIGMSLGMIQPVKGAIVGLQWANRMHGFGASPARKLATGEAGPQS